MLPKISIIIPVYNNEEYVSTAINSALNQTYDNTEVIVINDGSNDNDATEKKILKFSERIIYVKKENGGASTARNLGIEISTGDYIIFLDSDDWIDNKICELLINSALSNKSDVVICDYVRELENSSRIKHTFDKDRIFEGESLRLLHKRQIGLTGAELKDFSKFDALATACARLYRKDIIKDNNITFYDIKKIGTFEDGLFNIEFFNYAKKAVYIDAPLYHYRKTNVKSVTKKYKPDLVKKHERIHCYLKNYIDSNSFGDEYNRALESRIAFSLLGYGLNILKSPDNHIKKLKEILNNQYYNQSFKSLEIKYLPIHWRFFYLLARMKCASAIYILLLIINRIISR